ncbi:unnamed protein product [Ostreobium quekettii]|uniref:Uncharacterized protein n=1 Tax=Ostreobium quekettii TaxID=121088 RepID=A0A8S1J408_9CHLO|nr:unnamed protein product [Ostreobium quekettii]
MSPGYYARILGTDPERKIRLPPVRGAFWGQAQHTPLCCVLYDGQTRLRHRRPLLQDRRAQPTVDRPPPTGAVSAHGRRTPLLTTAVMAGPGPERRGPPSAPGSGWALRALLAGLCLAALVLWLAAPQQKKGIAASNVKDKWLDIWLKRFNDTGAAAVGPSAEGTASRGNAAVEGLDMEQVPPDGQQPAPKAHVAPKVALMFLGQGPMPLEAVWRAFLEAAARVELKVDLELPQEVNLAEVIGGSLKPPLEPLQEYEYPSNIIQKKRKEIKHGGRRRILQRRRRALRQQAAEGQGQGQGVDAQVQEKQDPGCWATNGTVLQNEVDRLLAVTSGGAEVVSGQRLFSIYVNAPESHHFQEGSVFYGRKIPNLVDTEGAYALFLLVQAQMNMLQEALKDPLNKKFVMLSDSTIPVHRPEIVYLQLIHEKKTRVGACPPKPGKEGALNPGRWSPLMKTDFLNKSHWRKSSFWNVLNREHAELVLADKHVSEQFKRYCFSNVKELAGYMQNMTRSACVADEHFIPTLLASYGISNQTDCIGRPTWVEWPNKGFHPKTFKPDETNVKLIKRIQRGWGKECKLEPCLETAKHYLSGVGGGSCTPEAGGPQHGEPRVFTGAGFSTQPASCRLFARKFPKSGLRAALRALLPCDGGGLGYWCYDTNMQQ